MELSSELKREKKRLPFGWGRFGKALDAAAEGLEPGESILTSCVGLAADTHPLGVGVTNVVVVATDRRAICVATDLRGSARAQLALDYTSLTFAVQRDDKRSMTLSARDAAVVVRAVAKSQFADIVRVLTEKSATRSA